jgi:cytochrome c556
MKLGRFARTGLVLAGMAALFAVGCATGSKMMSGDIVADRQRLMKSNGDNWKDIQDKVKAGNIDAVAVNAEVLAINAMHIPTLFPQGSLTEKSKAKPDVWQKWAEFEQDARNMQTEAEKLRDAAKAKNAAEVQNLVKDFGRKACGTCHTPFRVPPPQR